MTKDLFSDLASSDAEIEAQTTKRSTTVEFECIECGGSGKWQGGRVNQHGNDKCWTCGGSGKVKTDPYKLRADRAKRALQRKQAEDDARTKWQADMADFKAEHPDMYAELQRAHFTGAAPTEFIASLAAQLFKKGGLSEKQIAAWYRGRAKYEEAKQIRQAEERIAGSYADGIDLQRIRDMFEAAVESGYKKPTYRAEGLVISRAPDGGKNPGMLYVKNEAGAYQGKIEGATFRGTPFTAPGTADILKGIAEDPMAAAVRYGRKTGRCACCGRELTNALSVELGIGPVCRSKWSL